ncbi:MAG TPA: metal-dependent hydrolase [Candidatus Methanofastidiosa archaeon]|nr:metal-dependent hydrolase [Candidatus Methanofastidiosa archaeon]HPR42453.1 metal-dependent hydrolase [Candidatus Methanofastidiosa archaeon]
MESKTHLAFGILFSLFGLLALWGGHGLKMFDMVLWTCIFSLLPNIDRTLFRRRERSFTHSLLFVLAVFLVIYALPYVFDAGDTYVSNLLGMEGALYASLALLSHIVADSLTTSGVPVLYPLLPRRHFLFPYIGSRLRFPDDYANNHIQLLGLLTFISLLIFDIMKYVG